MKKLNYFLALASFAVLSGSLSATTVIPPSFDQLVNQAEVIFQGNVTKVASEWIGEGAQRHIVSYVTFHVKDGLKGNPGENYTIRMYGGTVGDETMGIADAPSFKVGDEDILFVENNGSQVVPLVGIMHGRFHVRRDQSGRESITTNEDEPLQNVARLGTATTSSYAEAVLTPASFKAAIQSKLQGGHTTQ
jgi:hypothetical protein